MGTRDIWGVMERFQNWIVGIAAELYENLWHPMLKMDEFYSMSKLYLDRTVVCVCVCVCVCVSF